MVEHRVIEKLFTVHVEREFIFPIETVFDAWLDVENLGNWLFGTPGGTGKVSEVNPVVGGNFKIGEIRDEELAMHVGTFHELDRPNRIIFSYYMEGENEDGSTNVVIDFSITSNGCLIKLAHEMDAVWSEYEDLTIEGWTMVFNGLEKHLT
jgi:uncharacterized protein YndB with AHSA1/START domain